MCDGQPHALSVWRDKRAQPCSALSQSGPSPKLGRARVRVAIERCVCSLELSLERGLRGPVVVADRLRFPATIVAARVTLIELEAKVLVPASEQEADTEWPLACEDDPRPQGRGMLAGQRGMGQG